MWTGREGYKNIPADGPGREAAGTDWGVGAGMERGVGPESEERQGELSCHFKG